MKWLWQILWMLAWGVAFECVFGFPTHYNGPFWTGVFMGLITSRWIVGGHKPGKE